jgi:hypothetical protein
MTFVLSIVACSPEELRGEVCAGVRRQACAGAPGGGPAPARAAAPCGVGDAGDDGNVGLERIEARMRAALAGSSSALGYEARLERAAYVRDIAITLSQLRAAGREPDLVQIIGHGSPGRLQLGSYWTGKAFDPEEGHAALTSNPETYGMLLEHLRPRCRVFLLGCHVGAERRSGYVTSGKALLYGLEVMTGAYVYGSDGLVTPEDFGDGFLYDGSLVMSCGKPANPGAIAKGRAARRSREQQVARVARQGQAAQAVVAPVLSRSAG